MCVQLETGDFSLGRTIESFIGIQRTDVTVPEIREEYPDSQLVPKRGFEFRLAGYIREDLSNWDGSLTYSRRFCRQTAWLRGPNHFGEQTTAHPYSRR